MIRKLLVILLSIMVVSEAAPPATYDQRQDGDLNVKVDLDNFLILVARPSSDLDLVSSFGDLMFDAKRAAVISQISAAQDTADAKDHLEPIQSSDDVGKAKGSLDDASIDSEAKSSELPQESEKVVVVVQEGDKAGRSFEEIARTLRNLKGKEAILQKIRGFAGKYKFVESVAEPQNLRLIGDSVENCGPGRSRDRFGICQSDESAHE